jgi:hypothetical protein
MKLKHVSTFGLAAALIALSGCASFNALTATQGTIFNNTVQFATAEYISKAGPAGAGNTAGPEQLARAQKVKGIALEIQGLDTGTVTIAQLQATVQADIAKLSPPDQILANGLLTAIVQNLGVQQQTGLLNTAVQAQINLVMNDVITACNFYITSNAAKKAALYAWHDRLAA